MVNDDRDMHNGVYSLAIQRGIREINMHVTTCISDVLLYRVFAAVNKSTIRTFVNV